jgi:two-component sensor histidine kinase
LNGPERRRAIARIREQVYQGHGCTHFEALQILGYLDQLQEQLIVIYASEEWALATMDRRFHVGLDQAGGGAALR